jgi:hypothetical protein
VGRKKKVKNIEKEILNANGYSSVIQNLEQCTFRKMEMFVQKILLEFSV